MKPAISFTFSHRSTFVEKDLRILEQHFEVSRFDFFTLQKWKTPFLFLKQWWYLLRQAPKAKLYLIQFAGYHSWLPCLMARITMKPAVIIIGGTDAVAFPSIGYGNFQKRGVKQFTEWSYKLSTFLLPKHISLLECDYTYLQKDHLRQGVFYFMPGLHKPFRVIANGYDSTRWKAAGPKKPKSLVTVSSGWHNPFQFELKGIDLLYETALLCPDFEFTVLGVPQPNLLPPPPTNVTLLPPVPNAELPAVLSQYRYYLQLSLAEGFPNALCEAMLCECVPLVSNVFSMPEIVQDSGWVLIEKDAVLLAEIILNSTLTPLDELGQKARASIATRFPLQKRADELTQTIQQLLNA